jgi:hypothetical protein
MSINLNHAKMKRIIFLFILACLSSSCVTTKWKMKYMLGKYKDFSNKYAKDSSLTLSVDGIIGGKKLKDMSKKEVKHYCRELEFGIARVPDSVLYNAGNIDSFYFNPAKAAYLKRHGLITKNIHISSTIR